MISHFWRDHICYPLRLRRLQITRNRAAADGREGARSRCAELVGAAQLARLRLSGGTSACAEVATAPATTRAGALEARPLDTSRPQGPVTPRGARLAARKPDLRTVETMD